MNSLYEYLETLIKDNVEEHGVKGTIYKNPSMTEIANMIKNQNEQRPSSKKNRRLRGFYDFNNDAFYIFDDNILHEKAFKELEKEVNITQNKVSGIYIDLSKKEITLMRWYRPNEKIDEESVEQFKNNSWYKNILDGFKLTLHKLPWL